MGIFCANINFLVKNKILDKFKDINANILEVFAAVTDYLSNNGEISNYNDNNIIDSLKLNIENARESAKRQKELSEYKGKASQVEFERSSAAKDTKSLYIFTDNTNRDSGKLEIDPNSNYNKRYNKDGKKTLHYPTRTQAVLRGLDNAMPISTLKTYVKGQKVSEGNWKDDEIEEFKKVIDLEIEDIKNEWNTGKYSNLKIGLGDVFFNSNISNITLDRSPQLYMYLVKKLSELYIYIGDNEAVDSLLKMLETNLKELELESNKDSNKKEKKEKTEKEKEEEEKKKKVEEEKKKIILEVKESIEAKRPVKKLIDISLISDIIKEAIPELEERRAIISVFSDLFSSILTQRYLSYKDYYNSLDDIELDEDELELKKALNKGTEEELRLAVLNLMSEQSILSNEQVDLPLYIFEIIKATVNLFAEANTNEKLKDITKQLLYNFDNNTNIRSNPFGNDFYYWCQLNPLKNKKEAALALAKRLYETFKKINKDEVLEAIMYRSGELLEYTENIRLSKSYTNTERTAEDDKYDDDEGNIDNRTGLGLIKYKLLLPSRTMSVRIKRFLSSIYDKRGDNYQFNYLGLRSKLNYNRAYYILVGELSKMNRPEDFNKILDNIIDKYSWFQEIKNRLNENNDLKNEFYSTFRNVFIHYGIINEDGTVGSLNKDVSADSILNEVIKNYESGMVLNEYSIYDLNGQCNSENVRSLYLLFYNGIIRRVRKILKEDFSKLDPEKIQKEDSKRIAKIIDVFKVLNGVHPDHPKTSLSEILKSIGIDTANINFESLIPNIDIEEELEKNRLELLENLNEEELEDINWTQIDIIKLKELITNDLVSKIRKLLNAVYSMVNPRKDGHGGFKPGMHLVKEFTKLYLIIGNILPITSEAVTEVSMNFNNKPRSSYGCPNFISEFIGILSNIDDLDTAKEYIETNYKDIDYYYDKNTEEWRSPWLEFIYNAIINKDTKSLNVLKNFSTINILGINGNEDKNTIQKTDLLEFISGIIKSFFSVNEDSEGNLYGLYRNPLFSDVDALVMFKFLKYSESNSINGDFKYEILKLMLKIFEAEIDRIMFLNARTNHDNDIENYNKNGKKFFFFPSLNAQLLEILDYLSDLNVKYTNKEINLDNYKNSRDNYIYNLLKKRLEENFELFYSNYGTDLLYNLIIKLKNSKITKVENLDNSNEDESDEEENEKLEEEESTPIESDKVKEEAAEELKRKVFEEFYYNDALALMELMRLLGGDPCLYTNFNDFIKRMKLVYASGKKGYFIDENGNRMTRRGIYLDDRLSVASSWKDILELLKESPEFFNMDKEVMLGTIHQILNTYKDIETTNGLSLVTLDSIRTILKLLGGKWTEDMEAAFLRIKDGTFNASDFLMFWNSIKPFMFSYEKRILSADDSGNHTRTEKVITQHKNSEYILSALYTVLNTKLNKSPLLKGLQKFMQKYNIDVVHFKSVVKVGYNNPFNLDYDENKFRKFMSKPNKKGEILYNGIKFKLTDDFNKFKEELFSKLENGIITQNQFNEIVSLFNFEHGTENDVFDTLESQLFKDGILNDNMFHDFDLNDLIIVLPTDDHFIDEVAIFGSLLRNIMSADIPFNSQITVKINGTETTLSGKLIIDFYNMLITDLLLDSFKLVNLKFNNVKKLKDYIDTVIRGNPKYGKDVQEALRLNKDETAFELPFNSPNLLNKIEEILLSAFKNAIQRLQINGGSTILVSNYGLSDNLRIERNSDGSVKWILAYLPANMSSVYKDYLVEKKDENNTYWAIDFEKLEKNADPELLEIIGYRIPTEAKYSIMPIRIMGFMPVTFGTTIMLPSEIINMSGTDFDVDKLFLMIRNAEVAIAGKEFKSALLEYINKNNLKDDILLKSALNKPYYTLEFIDQLLELNKDFADFYDSIGINKLYKTKKLKVLRGRKYLEGDSLENASKLDYIHNITNRKKLRDNMLIDTMFSLLVSKEVFSLSLKPGNFNTLKRGALEAQIYMNPKVLNAFIEIYGNENILLKLKELSNKELEEFLKLYENIRDPYDILLYGEKHENLMLGNDLIGISAVNSSNHYKLLFINAKLRENAPILYFKHGNKLYVLREISKVYSPIDGHLITSSLAEVLAAAPDNGKYPVLGYLNVNNRTINRFDLLIKFGVPLDMACIINTLDNDAINILSTFKAQDPITSKDTILFDGDFNKIIDILFKLRIARTKEETELIIMENKNMLRGFAAWINELDKMAEELSLISSVSRCDSTNGALPVSIAEAILLRLRAENFIMNSRRDNSYFLGLDELINIRLNPLNMTLDELRLKLFESPISRLLAFYTLGIEGALLLASKYLPLLNSNVLDVLSELRDKIKKPLLYNKDIKTIKEFYKDLNIFIMSALLPFASENENTLLDKRNFYIHDFPMLFKQLMRDKRNLLYKYTILRNLGIRNSFGITYENIGNNTLYIRLLYSEDLNDMLTNKDNDISNAAFDLWMYSYFNTGLAYRHNSYGILYDTAFYKSINGFLLSLKDTTIRVLNSNNILEAFLFQFMINNPDIVPLIKWRNLKGEGIISEDGKFELHAIKNISSNYAAVGGLQYMGSDNMVHYLPLVRVRDKKGKIVMYRLTDPVNGIFSPITYNTTGLNNKASKTPFYNARTLNSEEFLEEIKEMKKRGTIIDLSLLEDKKENKKDLNTDNIKDKDMTQDNIKDKDIVQDNISDENTPTTTTPDTLVGVNDSDNIEESHIFNSREIDDIEDYFIYSYETNYIEDNDKVGIEDDIIKSTEAVSKLDYNNYSEVKADENLKDKDIDPDAIPDNGNDPMCK